MISDKIYIRHEMKIDAVNTYNLNKLLINTNTITSFEINAGYKNQ